MIVILKWTKMGLSEFYEAFVWMRTFSIFFFISLCVCVCRFFLSVLTSTCDNVGHKLLLPSRHHHWSSRVGGVTHLFHITYHIISLLHISLLYECVCIWWHIHTHPNGQCKQKREIFHKTLHILPCFPSHRVIYKYYGLISFCPNFSTSSKYT